MASEYNRLSVKEKEARNRMHELPTRCQVCEMAVQPDDLLAHVETRCQGRPEPGPRARWIRWREAIAMGVATATLDRWVAASKVRVSPEGSPRRYLLRDLTKCISAQKGASTTGCKGKPQAKQLTKHDGKHPRKDMGKPMQNEIAKKLTAFVERVGGYASAGRKLDIPADTLRRAAKGDRIRRGTEVLIAEQLCKVSS